ncbi:MAG: hypothetical protein CSA36_08970 [Draconibacterium sp.]|nr:MAG: hypothetical protein CSA36_08970 [Draconibacterium sp.]
METTNKMKAIVTLFAVMLLATVSVSAQNYDDDVYYIPSKKKAKKEVKREQIVQKTTDKIWECMVGASKK